MNRLIGIFNNSISSSSESNDWIIDILLNKLKHNKFNVFEKIWYLSLLDMITEGGIKTEKKWRDSKIISIKRKRSKSEYKKEYNKGW